MRALFTRVRVLLRSIASLPSLIFFAYVGLAVYQLTTTDDAQELPAWLAPYNLGDLDTIRTTLAAVITGVFTLTIFAYTMVMNVLDRSISSYSPRLLPLILSERYHQEILGVGAGTIAHSVILLFGVADPPDFSRPPVLAVVSAGVFALVSLVLFIYFIHRVSRSIHINVLLYKSFCHTKKQLERFDRLDTRLLHITAHDRPLPPPRVFAERCGYLGDLDYRGLLDFSQRLGKEVYLHPRPGSFVNLGDPVLSWEEGRDTTGEVRTYYSISENEPVTVYSTGFKHLVEVAIKAASPAINDPATAMSAVHYLGQLFQILAGIGPYNAFTGPQDAGVLRIHDWQLGTLLDSCYTELRRYLAEDPWAVATLRATLQDIGRVCEREENAEGLTAVRQQLQQL